ncbi:hydrolase [Asticcacaulis sp.]|uniref:hydrolase n=1 Tax=Asticcacaulis sp. TaxID=1872648 RepID=UPI002B60B66E|nr:hydrolase [Asticcacaulis sp.]HTM82912.1 hydrolase [Asticcacaulis sp.]
MSLPPLDPRTTALVLIDLQKGIAGDGRAPYASEDVVARSKALAERFRAASSPVFLVHVHWAKDYSDALKQPVDQPAQLPADGPPAGWADLVDGLKHDGDIIIHKRNWGAFHGTDLDLHLRRRGIQTIVLAGIASNFGVESTARDAWERNYNLMVVEDACTTTSVEAHALAFKYIFPRISRVVKTADVTLA